uniref:Uncharacterized protein n=1 Tax=Rhizophora mucronata TaxID=61149 RepID=A0A2P2Q9Y2_RHIMU
MNHRFSCEIQDTKKEESFTQFSFWG